MFNNLCIHFFVRNTIPDRANVLAEHAANAAFFINGGFSFKRIKLNGLVCTVVARNITLPAADAFCFINHRNHLVTGFKVGRIGEFLGSFPYDFIQRSDISFDHVIAEAFDHVLHNPVTVAQNAGGNLQV